MHVTMDWAETHFGTVVVPDRRLRLRLFQIARALLANSAAALPRLFGTMAALKAAYRFFHTRQLTRQALSLPHWHHTRALTSQRAVTLIISDTTTLEYSAHRAVTGLGPIGTGSGHGYFVHTALAVDPATGTPLGVLHQDCWVRQPNPKSRHHRRADGEVESRVWGEGVTAIGHPPPGVQWVHVGDRAADYWPLFAACAQQDGAFVYRIQHFQRHVQPPQGEGRSLRLLEQMLPHLGSRTVAVAQKGGRPARTAQVTVQAGPVRLPPSTRLPKATPPLDLWLVIVQEPHPPTGVEPLEWWLWTSVPTVTRAQADERIYWYELRWLIEEYHQCLKTGCRVEARQFQTQAVLERLLGVVSVVAVALLQVRYQANTLPEQPAQEVYVPEVVQVVAHLAHVPPPALTCGQVLLTVAQRGGYLGRRGDGPPGWKTLWRGWQEIDLLIEGARLVTGPQEGG